MLLGVDFVLSSPFSPSRMSTLMEVDMLHFVNSVHQSKQDISTDYFRYLAFTTSALLGTCFSRVFNSIHCLAVLTPDMLNTMNMIIIWTPAPMNLIISLVIHC